MPAGTVVRLGEGVGPPIASQLLNADSCFYINIVIIKELHGTPHMTLSVFPVCSSVPKMLALLQCYSHPPQDLDFLFSLHCNQKCLRLFQRTRLSPTSFIILSRPPHHPHVPAPPQLSRSLLPTSFLLSLSRLNFIDASSLKGGECEFQTLSHCVWPLLSR